MNYTCMQICDVERGTVHTYHTWLMLVFVFATFISRIPVALVSPEGFIMEVKIVSLENIDISHQTVNYLIRN